MKCPNCGQEIDDCCGVVTAQFQATDKLVGQLADLGNRVRDLNSRLFSEESKQKFPICLRCGARSFTRLLKSSPMKHPNCGGAVVHVADLFELNAVLLLIEP